MMRVASVVVGWCPVGDGGRQPTPEQVDYIGQTVTSLAGVVYTIRHVYVSPHPTLATIDLMLSAPGETAPTTSVSVPQHLAADWVAGRIRVRVFRDG